MNKYKLTITASNSAHSTAEEYTEVIVWIRSFESLSNAVACLFNLDVPFNSKDLTITKIIVEYSKNGW